MQGVDEPPAPLPPIPEAAQQPSPPSWWECGRYDELFAEVLYVLEQRPPEINHYVFNSHECAARFADVPRAHWLEATTLAYLEHAFSTLDGAIRLHFKALRSKRARVAPPVDLPRRRRRTPNLSAGRVWVDDAGRGIWTDSNGRVLPA